MFLTQYWPSQSSKMIRPLAFLVALMLASHISLIADDDCNGQEVMLSAEAAAYLDEALGYMEEGSINSAKINWPILCATVYEKAAGAQSPSDTYEAIRYAIWLLKDHHSVFLTPEQVSRMLEPQTENIDIIRNTSRLIDPDIGYVVIPEYRPWKRALEVEYAYELQDIIASLDQHRIGKWIIDLRGNRGGNMAPMVLGAGPLLLGGKVGSFKDGVDWIIEGNKLTMASVEVLTLDSPLYQLSHPDPSIAILVDRSTASSGEACAIAFRGRDNAQLFGQKTGGYTSANERVLLSDGAVMVLATTYMVDRTGTVYEDGITPDVIVDEEGDAILQAAIDWLGSP